MKRDINFESRKIKYVEHTWYPLNFVKIWTISSVMPMNVESFKVFYLIFGANFAELQGEVRTKVRKLGAKSASR